MDLMLHRNRQRPVIILTQYYNMLALLDTGAIIPVWTGGLRVLESNFTVRLIKYNVTFNGFGGKALGDLYRISKFELGCLKYYSLPIIVVQGMENLGVQMILSATMFSNLNYTIKNKEKVLSVDIGNEILERHLEVKDSEGHLHILCTDSQKEEFKWREQI